MRVLRVRVGLVVMPMAIPVTMAMLVPVIMSVVVTMIMALAVHQPARPGAERVAQGAVLDR